MIFQEKVFCKFVSGRAIVRGVTTWTEKDNTAKDRVARRLPGTEQHDNKDLEDAARTGRNVALVAAAGAVVVNALIGIGRALSSRDQPTREVIIVREGQNDESKEPKK